MNGIHVLKSYPRHAQILSVKARIGISCAQKGSEKRNRSMSPAFMTRVILLGFCYQYGFWVIKVGGCGIIIGGTRIFIYLINSHLFCYYEENKADEAYLGDIKCQTF
jgi:hypothetical protein